METRIRPGVAANHVETAEVGASILRAGGSAGDAAVAAALASCVAEALLTGLGGGGFATYYEAATGKVTCLDFFVPIPGLGSSAEPAPMTHLDVSFGGVVIPYEVGASSVAVPGMPAGCAEVHARFGRLPWSDVVQPAIDLARRGVTLTQAGSNTLLTQAAVMVLGDGGGIYVRNGDFIRPGETVFHPGLAETLTALAEEGADIFYTGRYGELLIDTITAGGGVMTEADLSEYRVLDLTPVNATFLDYTVRGRLDLNATLPTLGSLAATDAVSVTQALINHGKNSHGSTTNLAVVDNNGDACVITSTLGLGSGVWLPGLGIHLNCMLGETELMTTGPASEADLAPPQRGDRMASMMCPLVVTDDDGLVLAAGSAGASRIRTAIVHTLVGVLADGLTVEEAISQPRFHPADGVLHVEPGLAPHKLEALARAGYTMQMWDEPSLYFGGASAVGISGAAGDPRRGGKGIVL